MNSSKKKNRNEDRSDEEYVVSEFSYVSTPLSNDHGNATVSICGAQRMRESFHTHFITVAFGFFNENTASGTTQVNAETGTMTATKNEKACTGTTPVDAETGTTAAARTRNEKATVAEKLQKRKPEQRLQQGLQRESKMLNQEIRKRLQEIQQEQKKRTHEEQEQQGVTGLIKNTMKLRITQQEQEKLDHVT